MWSFIIIDVVISFDILWKTISIKPINGSKNYCFFL